MEQCYSEVSIRVDAVPSRISRLESTAAVYCDADLEIDSSAMDHLDVRADGRYEDITMRNCTVMNELETVSPMSASGTERPLNLLIFGPG